MRARIFMVALVSWMVGVLSGLGYVTLSGDWYEYHYFTAAEVPSDTAFIRLLNEQGWQLIPGIAGQEGIGRYLRRPRFRLP